MKPIFYILGGLLLVYILIGAFNKKQGRRRRARTFMDGQRLKDRRNRKNDGDPGVTS